MAGSKNLMLALPQHEEKISSKFVGVTVGVTDLVGVLVGLFVRVTVLVGVLDWVILGVTVFVGVWVLVTVGVGVIPKQVKQLEYGVDAETISFWQQLQDPLPIIVKQSISVLAEFTNDTILLLVHELNDVKEPPTIISELSFLIASL